MTSLDARAVPVDAVSAETLAAAGLDYRLADLSDEATAQSYQRAVSRGFLGDEPDAQALAFGQAPFQARRNAAVYDPASPAADFPVATVNSWVTPLTVPGGAAVDMWAISVVTVAATHRRRGIARALLEGELRAAASAGVPVAGLTVSEATIYGRYGFGAAVPTVRLDIDARRAGWAGPTPSGRIEYREREQLADDLAAVHERARLRRPGQIPGWRTRWEGFAGLSPSDTERDRVRGVRYLDDEGALRGVLVYTLAEKGGSFRFGLHVRMLVAETPDATAALWRFALQHDLVDDVTADLRPTDDPLPWLVADPRGVVQTVHDHGWLRILDLPTALAARHWSAPLDTVLRVEDPLGFTAGDWRLRIDQSGAAVVESAADDAVDARLGVAALSALYAGGVSASALHGAGLIDADPGVVERLDRALASFPAPSLDIWY
ncbi:putative acetyltransferase [Microbacterium natoriense]|uniref:Acetyltransferase n=1 Tax=Microbacterium natoriense TaxID=284570 RepID=A0AAW8EYD4_9MICO|nr:GNAT family N-acetyltransferase [Microbacterium natoriense]MDQ0647825.1 putative acetyltransferase [Microbacterium natoriense]